MKSSRIFAITLLLVFLLVFAPQQAMAGVWNNAYSYYNTYGDSVVFRPTTETDGIIYYATKGSQATASVRFQTLGWRVRVQNQKGTTIQEIYYKLGGAFMTKVDTTAVSGYEYNLYSMSLYNLKRRMNSGAAKALADGSCRILLDACMTVKKNGSVQGSMSDSGALSGRIYTTYSGIAGAENWNTAAKQSLHSYFGKEVEGLFFDVEVRKSTGISEVSGSGHYLYGTYMTAAAKVKKGYTFRAWSGLYSGKQIAHSFYVNKSGTMTAKADPIKLQIVYHRNHSAVDETAARQTVKYGESGSRMQSNNWKKNGKKALGYALSRGAVLPNYALNAAINDDFIWKYAPEIHLYAVWEESSQTDEDITPPEIVSPEPVPPEPIPPSDPVVPDTGGNPENPYRPKPVPDSHTPPNVTIEQEAIRTRFISRIYFEDARGNLISRSNGGLAAGSRWAYDDVLRSLLRRILAVSSV